MTTEAAARAYSKWAFDLKREIAASRESMRCEVCADAPWYVPYDRQQFEVHHIGSGCDKAPTRMDRRTVLIPCWSCHDKMDDTVPCPRCRPNGTALGKHSDQCFVCGRARVVKRFPVAMQLAILKLRRERDFDIDVWNSLVSGARRVTEAEVEVAVGNLTNEEWWRT